MRLHRFYLKDIEKQGDLWITRDPGFIHQLKNVFRVKKGQNIYVFNENIGEIELVLEKLDKKDMSFGFIRQVVNKNGINKNKRQVNLYMSIIKNNNFDLVVEKAVELGVNKIIPIISERTIKNNINIDRSKKIIIEATEQSGRLDLMAIGAPIKFLDVIFNNENYKIFGSIENKINTNDKIEDKNIDIFIGPEGGFSEQEIEFLKQNDVTGVCINENVLRAETAAIAFATIFGGNIL